MSWMVGGWLGCDGSRRAKYFISSRNIREQERGEGIWIVLSGLVPPSVSRALSERSELGTKKALA